MLRMKRDFGGAIVVKFYGAIWKYVRWCAMDRKIDVFVSVVLENHDFCVVTTDSNDTDLAMG